MAGIQEDKILRINLRNFLSLHLPTIILILVGVGILSYLRFEKHFVQVFVVVWILDLLPALYLHLTYLSKNRGEEYVVRDSELIRRKNGEETIYKNDGIEKDNCLFISSTLQKTVTSICYQ